MCSEEVGFFASSVARTRSLLHSHTLRPRTIIKHRSLQFFSHKNAELRPTRRPSQSSAQPAMLKSPLSRRDSKRGFRASKKSKLSRKGTILRAVPGATACATFPLSPKETDTSTVSRPEVMASSGTASCTSPRVVSQASFRSHPQNNKDRSHTPCNNGTALSPIPARAEMQFPELKGTIGIYKHGRILWEQKDKPSPSIRSSASRRPRIQVVIPKDQRNRPLPTSPFFGQVPFGFTPNSAIPPAPVLGFAHDDVSPPSGTKQTKVRQSVVSPMSTQQHRHPVRPFHPLVVPQRPQGESESGSPNKGHISLSNSSDEYHEDDASSSYSKRSSMTSVEGGCPPQHSRLNFQERTASATFSIKSPVLAGIFDGDASGERKPRNPVGETGPRSYTPTSPPPRRYAPHPSIEEDTEFVPTCALRPLRNSLQRRPTTTRKSLNRGKRRTSILADSKRGMINQAINRCSSAHSTRHCPSPTLSEAENDLEQQLTTITDDDPFSWDEVVPDSKKAFEVTVPPVLPRKSSKRQTPLVQPDFRLSGVPFDHIASQLKRNGSFGKGKGLKIEIPGKVNRLTRMTESDFVLSPIPEPSKATNRPISPTDAENVILTILRNLESFDDLFATAVLNRGFYRVFKRHELDLMKSALRKMSPPAWEHREICYPGHDDYDDADLESPHRREYTPSTYLQYYTRDMYIIAALKSLIKDKCQSFLRPEMAVALVSGESPDSARVDDALWRIWTFCKIFGCGKGREEDIVAQMDWLKGGVLVHQKTCTFSILSTDSIAMNDTLASAPECFGKGNEGGLTPEQLFDMMELWNCLGVLLQPFEGRTTQAREYGVYENTQVRGGDIDGEEMMLDEWYYYLLTLGLSTILDLAAPCRLADPSAFILAQQNGWIDWAPPVFGGTRRNFLKEAASRVYEDKIVNTYAESTKEVQRQLSKQRIQRHITELRNRKNSNERFPAVRMSQERPISEWEEVLNNLTRPRPPPSATSNLVSHIPTLRGSISISQLPRSIPELAGSDARSTPNNHTPRSPLPRIVAQPLLPTPPPSTVPSTAGDDRRSPVASVGMPSIEEHPAFRNHNHSNSNQNSIPEVPFLQNHPAYAQHMRTNTGSSSIPSNTSSSHSHARSDSHPAFQQHHLQHTIFSSDAAENTADKAVYRIVEMGFTPDQARQALRMTDMGDGLRVDRAVELLLRGT